MIVSCVCARFAQNQCLAQTFPQTTLRDGTPERFSALAEMLAGIVARQAVVTSSIKNLLGHHTAPAEPMICKTTTSHRKFHLLITNLSSLLSNFQSLIPNL
jgi:hypothetical protein